jgi:hypothetical protein
MNSMPADSRAALSAASFAAVTGISPSIVSTRRAAPAQNRLL